MKMQNVVGTRNTPSSSHSSILSNVKQLLELDDVLPLLLLNLVAVVFLECVDAKPRDSRVQWVVLLDLPSVHGLVGTLNLDSHSGLAGFGDWNLLVFALDRCPADSALA